MGQDEFVFRVRRRSADADANRADERQMMRVGIAGAGAVGRSVAQELLDYGHKVLLIEHNVGQYEPHTVPDAEWLLADACELSSLEECGMQTCDVVIAATGDDKVNLTAALLAKTEFGVARVVARVNDMRNEWLFTTAIRWVHASPNAKLLARIVADGRPLSHDLLDELSPTAGVHYIRQIMVETGVLPRRNEDLERVPAWLDHHLADKPPEHANLVRPFLHWFLPRRARNRAAARRHPASAGRELRRRVRVALELLTWIDEQGMALEQLRQDDLDRWLDEEKTQRRNRIRYFLKWTADRGLTRSLAVAVIPRQQPADLLGDDERWQLLQRCLNNEAMPIDVRAAGALILLFGLQAQRIRHLYAEHVVAQDDNTYLTTGKHPILLPPRLGAIMRKLADRPPTRLMIQHGTDAPRWLFPGRVPGQPIDNHSLTNRLNRHGISARPTRNGALMALAADLPAAIIADLLGMHINTAIRWVRYAGRDWAAYLAARAAQQDKKSGDAGNSAGNIRLSTSIPSPTSAAGSRRVESSGRTTSSRARRSSGALQRLFRGDHDGKLLVRVSADG